MAVDYLSALNVGSGLNVTQIVDAIVDAERVPRETFLNEKSKRRLCQSPLSAKSKAM